VNVLHLVTFVAAISWLGLQV